MAKQTKTFHKVTISTDQNNPTAIKPLIAPPTVNEVQCVLSSTTGTWAKMMGPGILTIAVQQQLTNGSWLNVVQSTFDAQSTNKANQAQFSIVVAGLGGKTLRLAGWCTTSITIKAIITLTF